MQERLKRNLSKIFYQVKYNFIFKKDNKGEEWKMPPPGYDGKKTLLDDCDGFCLACRTLLRIARIPSRLVYCEVKGLGHLVVEVEGWILDIAQEDVIANVKIKGYQWLRISGYNPGDAWHEIEGFGVS